MAIYTKEELLAEKAQWKAALTACATGKSYTIGDRQLTRQDLSAIRAHLEWLEEQEAELGGVRTLLVRPFFRR